MSVLINNKKVNFDSNGFPMLISGAEKTGSSFFSLCLLADLFKDGHKVLFISAYPMAKEEFKKQIGSNAENAIIIESGEEDDIIKEIKAITDLEERIVLLKNIDSYSPKLFDTLSDLKLVIFSGDLDKCEFAASLINKNFPSKIFFSSSKKFPFTIMPDLTKYSGEMISERHKGIISLDL